MENIWKQINKLLKEQYGLEAAVIKPMTTGVGGETLLIDTNGGKYVFKLADTNEMNRPEMEPEICSFLLRNRIAVSKFFKSKSGNYLVKAKDGRCGHLQSFIEGDVFFMHKAPEWFMEQSALLLGNIHNTLCNYPDLPVGIGKEFFYYMTIKNARQSYQKSLATALQRNDDKIIEDLEFRIRLTENFPEMEFNLEKLTYRNTHGDYTVNQIICDDKEIKAVIDWTCACRHPVIWELTRSFFYAAPSCRDGELDEEKFKEYVKAYCSIAPLSEYDREQLLRLYYYQLAVCDYYSQYLKADESKKEEFLTQARFATNVLRKNT